MSARHSVFLNSTHCVDISCFACIFISWLTFGLLSVFDWQEMLLSTLVYNFLYGHVFSFLLDIEHSTTFQDVIQLYIPSNNTGEFHFLHTLTNTYYHMFDCIHLVGVKRYPCHFGLHFLLTSDWWASFHIIVGHLYIFFQECLFKFIAHFWIGLFGIFLVVVEFYELFILDIKPLSDIWFARKKILIL